VLSVVASDLYSEGGRRNCQCLLSTGLNEFVIVIILDLFLRSVLVLVVTAIIVPSSLILVTLMMEAIRSPVKSVLTRVTRRHIPEDGSLYYYYYYYYYYSCCNFLNYNSDYYYVIITNLIQLIILQL
jgi:hypothetical protein